MNSTQSQPVRGTVRPAAAVAFGVAAVSIALVSIVALGGLGGRGGNGGHGGAVVPPPPASPTAPAATPKPSSDPTQAPPPAVPSAEPTQAPTPPRAPAPETPIKVDLKNATDADVTVDVVDYTGDIVGAVSGTPGEGMSVDTITADLLGPTTLKLTWTDFGIDNALTLYIYRTDGGYRLVMVEPEPTGPADAMGYDRELILTFVHPISASQVEVSLQDGKDTPG